MNEEIIWGYYIIYIIWAAKATYESHTRDWKEVDTVVV
jgi:hypothetical protein